MNEAGSSPTPEPGSRFQRPERKVGMGEIETVRGVFRLRTLLGSCIGLVLYDLRTQVGGLAHIVLPDSKGQSAPLGKYANTAIPEMLKQIEQLNGRVRYLTAKVIGGASMFSTFGPMAIGDQNAAAVEQLLKDRGIPVLGRDCGGRQGRRVAFDVDTGRVTVETVGEAMIEI
jgi:chemotaxis protein CheD